MSQNIPFQTKVVKMYTLLQTKAPFVIQGQNCLTTTSFSHYEGYWDLQNFDQITRDMVSYVAVLDDVK